MVDSAPPPGWWQASDGNWYPPTSPAGSPFAPPPAPSSNRNVVWIVVGVVAGLILLLGLVGAVVIAVNKTDDRAQREACQIERRTLRTALEAWKAEGDGLLPPSLDELYRQGQFLDQWTVEDMALRWRYKVSPDQATYGLTGIGKCEGLGD